MIPIMRVKMRSFILFSLCCLLALAENEKELDWWETTVFYQIYPRSFQDSDGDGIGDLNGITSRLEYLKELGVGATWLSPIFKSPMYDFGYDIADFYAIQDEYGTMEDFDNLIAKANELDIKIILDFVPNHGSNESVWFEEALRGHEKYYDYFVWEDAVVDENGDLHPPNNWVSVFRKSAWEYREEVGKYYLHQFVIGQPDFNYRNPAVVEEMKNVVRFWLDKGVAGFRVDAIAHLFEVDKELYGGKYPDEPLSGYDDNPDNYDHLDHIYTKDQDETFDLVYQWREVFDEYKEKDGLTRVMMTEAYSSPQLTMRYFGDGERQGAQMPFNFVLISEVNGESSAADIKYAVDRFLTYKPLDQQANWVAGNHDNNRVASRYSPQLVDGINMIVLLLPGVAVTYMGEEIGMVDGFVSWEDTVDPSGCNTDDPINYWRESRDPARTPFQWNAEANAGFSTAPKTWLPLAAGYETLNVQIQSESEKSHLHIYKSLVRLRSEDVFKYGRYESVALNSDVFAFRRWYNGENYIVVLNFRNEAYTIGLDYFENVTGELEVVVSSVQSPKDVGAVVHAAHVEILGGESLVLKVNGHDHDHEHEDAHGHAHEHAHEHDHEHDHEHEHDHDHDHDHDINHDHDHGHGHDHDHGQDHVHDHGHDQSHDHDHDHGHDHDHDYGHGHDHDHDHSHEHDHNHDQDHDHGHDHDHDHDHGHDHDHDYGHGHDHDHDHSHEHDHNHDQDHDHGHDHDHDHDHNHDHDHDHDHAK